MSWTPTLRQFISDHLLEDTARLLLSAHRYPEVDVPFAVEQIEARRRLRTKLPEWYANSDLIMGGRIPAEQCSSEHTARFKRSVMLSDARSLCDMTGGMGVDFWYMSRGLDLAIYTERQHHLCEAARHNFAALASAQSESLSPSCSSSPQISSAVSSHPSIIIREGLSTELPVPDVDVIYLDPARRSTDGSRIYEISDCEPDVVTWQQELLRHCRQLIVKVSPMADISRTLLRLVHVTDLYVVSVRHECKELLVVQRSVSEESSVLIHCVDFLTDRTINFSCRSGERTAVPLADEVGLYFYEPDVSLMKAQCFSALVARFEGLRMFDTDCHYFTSDTLLADFPGRVFQVDERLDCSSHGLKRLRAKLPQANIATRCFPLTADQLRVRTGIRDGGEVYLFGARLHAIGAVLLRCHKVNLQEP